MGARPAHRRRRCRRHRPPRRRAFGGRLAAGVAEARARRAQRRRRARLRPDRGGPRALPQHRAERRDPLGGAGHGRAGRLGRF
ncbi:MAG: hypothetical protein DMD76_14235 [Candidatus Rokuibacteriota bacterium]|nr:MAG: hypothetical protein DMD76_14235 [Candidatus Rokubacteria bacterium]